MVEKAGLSVSGVEQVKVDLEHGKAKIYGSHFELDAVFEAISEAGYSASTGA